MMFGAAVFSLFATATSPGATPPAEPAALVNPLIGTGGLVPAAPGAKLKYDELAGHKPEPFGGLTYPGATLPFGMIALSPDANTDGFAWSGGKNAYDRTILGFSHMHQSGNGLAYGHFLVVPTAGPLQLEPGPMDAPEAGYRSRFRLETEKAQPGFYRVRLDDHGIEAALTVTPHVGFHRYEFPRTKDAHVLLDLTHAIGRWKNVKEAAIQVVDDRTVVGSREAEGRFGARPFFFAMTFSRPFKSFGIAIDDKPETGRRAAKGKKLKAFFDFDTTTEPVVLVKVALSPVSLEGARANLRTELPGWDFDATARAARQTWNDLLGKVKVRGGTPQEQTVFESALYHSLLAPFVLGDADGSYRGADGQIHKDTWTNYTFFSVWDTVRAQNPLLTLLVPERVPSIVQSMVASAQTGRRTLPGAGGMAGHHAMPIIADAYAKGLRGFDAEAAFALMKENMLRQERGLGDYGKTGWVAADKEPRAAAHTLEYALDDWAVAEMAHQLGKSEDEALFRKRSENWKNVIDAKTGFARGRLADGSWRTPFDPRAVSHYQPSDDFVEANAWQYTFHVMHDVRGLVTRLGGPRKFVAKLDELFDQPAVLTGNYSADVSGLWGQYAQGNEQSHHVAYLYDWAGQPWKTQARVREVMKRFYTNTPEGIPGNDDAGATSAWYVWSALGFYPVNPVGGVYAIGSPLFDEARIDVGNGKTFVVKAENNAPTNVYIQSAKLNGRPLEKTWITHADLTAGGTLTFVMGPKPNRRWGAGPKAAPPSASDPR